MVINIYDLYVETTQKHFDGPPLDSVVVKDVSAGLHFFMKLSIIFDILPINAISVDREASCWLDLPYEELFACSFV
jgi:hypothetical protein